MEIVIVLVVLGLLLTGGLTYVALRRRDEAPELEPPSESRAAPTAVLEQPTTAAPAPTPLEEALLEKLTDEDLTLDDLAEELVLEDPVLEAPVLEEPGVQELAEEALVEAPPRRPSFRERLGRARSTLAGAVASVLARSAIDQDTWDELEEGLIRADVGVATTTQLLDRVRTRVEAESIKEPAALLEALKDELKVDLAGADRSLAFAASPPTIWLFVGVNGVGKTTTIGKLGKRAEGEGQSVVMAAGDTFRAAAAEQLGMWAERSGADFVRGSEGADPSSVIFDAVERAGARGTDLVLADTAGRLHTKVNLMEELRKVRRVADKGAGTVTEVLLVIDATTGQNGLVQAQQFTEAVEVTGVVLTKLDGSAKGGIVLAIQHELGLPVKLVGLGEGVDDLVEFDPAAFVEALFE
jgi:fused signal recognition particle receptor